MSATATLLAASRGPLYWLETGVVIFIIGTVIVGFLTVGYRIIVGKPIQGGDGQPLRLPGAQTNDAPPTTPPGTPAGTHRPASTTAPRQRAAHGTASQSRHTSISRTLPGRIAELDTIDWQPDHHWPVKLLVPPETFLQLTRDPTFHAMAHLTHWQAPNDDPHTKHRLNHTDDHVYLWYRGQLIGQLIGQLEGDEAWLVGSDIRQFEQQDHASVYCKLHWHTDGEHPATLKVLIGQDRIDEDNNSAHVTTPHHPPAWAGDHELRR